jgi:hypothetical protein
MSAIELYTEAPPKDERVGYGVVTENDSGRFYGIVVEVIEENYLTVAGADKEEAYKCYVPVEDILLWIGPPTP